MNKVLVDKDVIEQVNDYIQTYDNEVREQFWWDAFKIVVPPVFEEKNK